MNPKRNGLEAPTTVQLLQTLEGLQTQMQSLRDVIAATAAEISPPPPEPSPAARIRARVADAIREEQVATEAGLARRLGVTAATVHHHVLALAREGLVVLRKVWSNKTSRFVLRIYDPSAVLFSDERSSAGASS